MEQKVITFTRPTGDAENLESVINSRIAKLAGEFKLTQLSTCYCPTFEKGELKHSSILVTLLMEEIPKP